MERARSSGSGSGGGGARGGGCFDVRLVNKYCRCRRLAPKQSHGGTTSLRFRGLGCCGGAARVALCKP